MSKLDKCRSDFIKWCQEDEAVTISGSGLNEKIVMYCDSANGMEEIEYIVDRLLSLHAVGGGVVAIEVEHVRHVGPYTGIAERVGASEDLVGDVALSIRRLMAAGRTFTTAREIVTVVYDLQRVFKNWDNAYAMIEFWDAMADKAQFNQ
jgi:hypothetical protein